MTRETPDLDSLLAPESVAVVGASPDARYASQLLDNLLNYGFEDDVYPVNSGSEEVRDRHCYDALEDVAEPIDLAVISIPREHVVDTVRQAGEQGIPAALIITAGFGEADETGDRLERELAGVADEYDIDVCGPNCIGFANALDGTVLTSACSRQPGARVDRAREPVRCARVHHVLRASSGRGYRLRVRRFDRERG